MDPSAQIVDLQHDLDQERSEKQRIADMLRVKSDICTDLEKRLLAVNEEYSRAVRSLNDQSSADGGQSSTARLADQDNQ